MKKNDIAVLVLIVSVTALIAYFSGQAVLGNRTSKPVAVETAEPIAAEIAEPEKKIFNTDAINPTVKIEIGSTTNQQPFGN